MWTKPCCSISPTSSTVYMINSIGPSTDPGVRHTLAERGMTFACHAEHTVSDRGDMSRTTLILAHRVQRKTAIDSKVYCSQQYQMQRINLIGRGLQHHHYQLPREGQKACRGQQFRSNCQFETQTGDLTGDPTTLDSR